MTNNSKKTYIILLTIGFFSIYPVLPVNSEEISFANAANKRNIIAVSEFNNDTGNIDLNYLMRGLSDSLITRLSNGNISVVERNRFQSMLNEMGLAQSGMLDENNAARAGRAIGADKLITGALVRAANKYRFNVRMIETETGKIIMAFSEDIKGIDHIFDAIDIISDKIIYQLQSSANTYKNIEKQIPKEIPATNSENKQANISPKLDKISYGNQSSKLLWNISFGSGVSSSGLSGPNTYLGVESNQHLFTVRNINNFQIFSSDNVWDLGLLYGRSWRNSYGYVSASAGLGLVGGVNSYYYYDTPSPDPIYSEPSYPTPGYPLTFNTKSYTYSPFITVGVPLSLDLFWTPANFIGVGVQTFANLNASKSFVGGMFVLQFGSLRF